ncbi:C2H2-type zinc finger protein [Natronococcus sp. JC468]|uniref:C2H2-type zinc finger protein n=1 Tax=Natronococcus sp. JC468 TaxID=1961921 RepID=UPI00143C819A|nr:C2H2-type zinc finger protein [Natronococcus sp. JC468]NKE36711.1 C2H2-type zinc finger protein [Natronococcus sp. JC468]
MPMDPRDEENVDESDSFVCPVCNATFESQQALEDHGESEHEDAEIDTQRP